MIQKLKLKRRNSVTHLCQGSKNLKCKLLPENYGSVFRYRRGFILLEFLESGTKINCQYDTLIKKKLNENFCIVNRRTKGQDLISSCEEHGPSFF